MVFNQCQQKKTKYHDYKLSVKKTIITEIYVTGVTIRLAIKI